MSSVVELVLLPGWGASRRVWQPLIECLKVEADALGVALNCQPLNWPGYEDVPALSCADDLQALTQTMLARLPEKAHWLGWSLGGNLALHIAEQAPERVQQLMLLGSNPSFAQRDDWPWAMPEAHLQQFQTDFAQQPSKTLNRFQSLQAQGETNLREIKKQFSALEADTPSADFASLAAGLSWLGKLDQRQPSAAVVDKLHWLFAEQDALVPSTVAHQVRGQAYLLQDCAHLALLSQTTQLAKTILSIIRQEIET